MKGEASSGGKGELNREGNWSHHDEVSYLRNTGNINREASLIPPLTESLVLKNNTEKWKIKSKK